MYLDYGVYERLGNEHSWPDFVIHGRKRTVRYGGWRTSGSTTARPAQKRLRPVGILETADTNQERSPALSYNELHLPVDFPCGPGAQYKDLPKGTVLGVQSLSQRMCAVVELDVFLRHHIHPY